LKRQGSSNILLRRTSSGSFRSLGSRGRDWGEAGSDNKEGEGSTDGSTDRGARVTASRSIPWGEFLLQAQKSSRSLRSGDD
jgi:hypothetical protein